MNIVRDLKEVKHMYDLAQTDFSFWWIIPIIMMILCFLMMRGRKGSVMCGFGPCDVDKQQTTITGSAIDILNKRYASGEINKEEYEEKERTLTKSSELFQ